MSEVLVLRLEAHSDERNHHRRYEVSVDRDLLEHWVVTIRYGRVGAPLREVRLGGADVATAKAVVEHRLRRRLSAPKRIGCRYTVREINVAGDVVLADWVPPPLLATLA